MTGSAASYEVGRRACAALWVWVGFLALALVLNGTIPFALGADLRAWSDSTAKEVSFRLLVYGGVFLVVPLLLAKGWGMVRRAGFLAPLLLATAGITLGAAVRPAAALGVAMLAFLHLRFGLANLGIRTRGVRGDLAAVLVMGLGGLVQVVLRSEPLALSVGEATLAALDRLLANPASSVETLFYFGFLAERLSHRAGRLWTPLLIGAMYTAHELTNPEYWYEGTPFPRVFVVVAIGTWIYLWRRSVVVIWPGDGPSRFVTRLL